MSKYGLLYGLGQGAAQAGTMLLSDQLDKMKEQRLQKYQQESQQRQWERDDKVRSEDRMDQQTRDAQQLAFQSNVQLQNQANADRAYDLQEQQFEQSSNLIQRQIEQIDQQIETNEIGLDVARKQRDLRNQILSSTDPEEQQRLMGQYAAMASDFNDKPITITAFGEPDEMGEQTRTTMQWDSATRSWKAIGADQGAVERPSLEDLLETPAASQGGTGSQDNPMDYQVGAGRGPLIMGPPNNRYDPAEIASARGDTGVPGLLRRVGETVSQNSTANQLDSIENKISIARRSGTLSADNKYLDSERVMLSQIINSNADESIKQRARALYDQLR